MKKLIVYSLAAAMSLGLSTGALAAEKKAKGATPAPAAAPAEAKKPEEKPAEAKAAKPLPMHTRVDSLDAAGKSFTMKRKDGVEVKHIVTATTEFVAPAKFEDIKVGDYVNGLRLKKSETEYEVVKVTKVGPAPEKKEKAKAEAKPEAKPAAKSEEKKQ